jgi:hypothetical protein
MKSEDGGRMSVAVRVRPLGERERATVRDALRESTHATLRSAFAASGEDLELRAASFTDGPTQFFFFPER